MSIKITPIYTPKLPDPMRIAVFASGGGGNLVAAINASLKFPELLKVVLVVTDRFGIPAIEIAHKNKLKVISYDFEKECGVWSLCKKNPAYTKRYIEKGICFHNRILKDIRSFESGEDIKIDLIVLSYHRWIRGSLYTHFKDRMINQHAGDLTVMDRENSKKRRYVGINPVYDALMDKVVNTRTTTFLVRDGYDDGEIICQGPWVTYTQATQVTKKTAWSHEQKQKRESDWPSLTFALTEIAKGNFAITNKHHFDDRRKIVHKGKILPYGGVDLSKLK